MAPRRPLRLTMISAPKPIPPEPGMLCFYLPQPVLPDEVAFRDITQPIYRIFFWVDGQVYRISCSARSWGPRGPHLQHILDEYRQHPAAFIHA